MRRIRKSNKKISVRPPYAVRRPPYVSRANLRNFWTEFLEIWYTNHVSRIYVHPILGKRSDDFKGGKLEGQIFDKWQKVPIYMIFFSKQLFSDVIFNSESIKTNPIRVAPTVRELQMFCSIFRINSVVAAEIVIARDRFLHQRKPKNFLDLKKKKNSKKYWIECCKSTFKVKKKLNLIAWLTMILI